MVESTGISPFALTTDETGVNETFQTSLEWLSHCPKLRGCYPRCMSEFKFACPHCEQRLQCDERLGGRQIQCPACKHLITIPLSPAQLAAGQQALESGNTWNTYIPPVSKAPPKTS
jgi:hypothetical protein